MPTLKELENTDELYNPYNQRAASLAQQERQTGKDAGLNAGIDQIEKYANDPANSTKNIDAANQAEQARQGFYTGSGKVNSTNKKFSFKGTLRKKGPIGGLIGIITAIVGLISMVATPGLAAVQLKEILTDDLNDQLTAMDKRSIYVMRAKLNDIGKGVCTGVKIRCGFKGMSDRQLNKFKQAGFEVETDGKSSFGRNRIKSLSITDSGGNKITVTNPSDLNKALGDKSVRNALRKAFNPKFAGFFDAKWDKFKSRFKLTSRDKLGTGTEDEKRTAVSSAVEGNPGDFDEFSKSSYATDDNGNPIPDKETDTKNALADRGNAALNADGVPTSSVLSAGSSGAIKGLGALGAADVACSVKNSARAVEAGAKIYRYKQLMAYSMVFLTFADSIKAGTATPDQAEYVGNTLTAIDTREMIVDETSVVGESGADTKVKNPYYGANAFDSAGYKTAMYNDAPTLSARDMQMSIGGGLSLSMLSTVNQFIKSNGGDNCKIIQNWGVRGLSLIGGIALGVVSFGVYTAASVGASIAISMALPILENYISQMLAGTVADGNTNGVDTGNAIFAGSAALMGGMAMSRGMKPATKEDLRSYAAATAEVQSEYIAMESAEAKDTPFDINNRYSFLGSLARTLLPLKTSSSLSLGGALLNSAHILSSTALMPANTQAKSGFNEERFSKCADTGYKEIGIDADIFCNVRYVMSDEEMNMDTDAVRTQMLNWKQVNDDEEGTVVAGSDYEKWLEECTVRDDVGWGETTEESNAGTGKNCMNSRDTGSQSKYGDDNRLSHFRVYTMDSDIIAAMDYEAPAASETFDSTGGDIEFATYNVRTSTLNNSELGDPDRVFDTDDDIRMQGAAKLLIDNNVTIAATQEVRGAERKSLLSHLPEGWKATSLNQGKYGFSEVIFWDGKLYKQGRQGVFTIPKGGGEQRESIWTELISNATGSSVYVFGIHTPTSNDAEREIGAKLTLQEVDKVVPVGTPYIIAGDMNSNDTAPDRNAVFEVFKQSGLLLYTRTAVDNPKGNNCNTFNSPGDGRQNCGNGRGSHIDQIWVSKDPKISVLDYRNIATSEALKVSDHNPVITKLKIPGFEAESSNSSGEIAWPVPGVAQMGSLPYGSKGSRGVHKGIDIGISGGGALGKPVVATHSGVVSRVWGAGDRCGEYISIKVDSENYYAAYQHVANISVKTGDTVKAGQQIAVIGRQGGTAGAYGCGSGGFYHLHYSIESSPGMVSAYADPFPNGTKDPLKILPKP